MPSNTSIMKSRPGKNETKCRTAKSMKLTLDTQPDKDDRRYLTERHAQEADRETERQEADRETERQEYLPILLRLFTSLVCSRLSPRIFVSSPRNEATCSEGR